MNTFFTLFFTGHLLFSPHIPDIPRLGEDFVPAPPPEEITANIELSAESVLVMEIDSGVTVFEKNPGEKRAIASITKLMTALITLEEKILWETVSVPLEAAEIEGAQMHLLMGEKLQIGDLLQGLLIRSGNDAAVTLAFASAENIPAFVKKMNRKAHLLGLQNTSFANPHGLDDPEGYSTAHDVALLAKKILEYDFVRKTVLIRKIVVTDITGEFPHELKTTNKLLGTPFPIYGLKTGTTDEAGECFVGLTEVGGKEYLLVILGSESRFQDAKGLIWALEQRNQKKN